MLEYELYWSIAALFLVTGIVLLIIAAIKNSSEYTVAGLVGLFACGGMAGFGTDTAHTIHKYHKANKVLKMHGYTIAFYEIYGDENVRIAASEERYFHELDTSKICIIESTGINKYGSTKEIIFQMGKCNDS